MKKYFIKYLPVEGEIKDGDYWQHPKGPIFPWTPTYQKGSISTGLMKKVKLFLCSRDIQVGDKVYWTDPAGETSQFNTAIEVHEDMIFMSEPDSSEIEAFPHEVVKIIGEVSPNATWVKEGDEFDEDDWQLWCYALQLEKPRYNTALPIHVKIKGPCGHFH